MSDLNILCPICTEVFKNSDEIVSTNCGHIFHFECVRGWYIRSHTCPQCRRNNPITYKLYLNFDDSHKNPTLKEKLKNSDITIQKLHDKLVELNNKLQNQYAVSEKLMWELMERIKQTNQLKSHFLRLQEDHNKSGQFIKHLEEKIQVLTTENKRKSNNLNIKTIECTKLKTSLEAATSGIILNGKSKSVYQKLKNMEESKNKENNASHEFTLKSTEITRGQTVLEVTFPTKMHEIKFLKFLNTL